ncbi:hypothetical protein Q427_32535 [Halomonas sp. BC04]|nr:hypothetical protein Q427_32535 [Halomonas sp. BC04]
MLPTLTIVANHAASAKAPIGASRDAEQRSNNDTFHRRRHTAVGGSFSSGPTHRRLEAEGLPVVLPTLTIVANHDSLRRGASRDGNSERRTERSNSCFLHRQCRLRLSLRTHQH